MKRLLILFLFVLSAGHVAVSQADDAAYDMRISNVRLFDGNKVIESANVYVRDGKVARIDDSLDARALAKFEVDGSGKTLLPGLINSHAHVQKAEHLRESARAGITTVLDLFTSAERMAEMQGYRKEHGYARIFSAGAGVTVPGSHGTQFGPTPIVTGPEDVAPFVDARIAEGIDLLKVIIEDADGRIPSLDQPTTKEVAKVAADRGLVAVGHISSLENALLAHDAGLNGIVHIWSRGGKTISESDLAKMANSDFFVIPTLHVWEKWVEIVGAEGRTPREVLLDETRRLHEAGVTLLVGHDPPNFGMNFASDYFAEMYLMEEAAVPVLSILKGATSSAAGAFRLKGRGVIQVGAVADMLLVNGDPTTNLRDIENVSAVWLSGQAFH